MRRALPFLLLLAACGGVPEGAPVRVTVPVGASFGQVTDSLMARGLLRSPSLFRFAARLRGTDRSVKAGVYDLPPHASAWQLLAALEKGRVATVRFTVPEGLTLLQLCDLAEQRLGIPAESVLVRARDRGRVQCRRA